MHSPTSSRTSVWPIIPCSQEHSFHCVASRSLYHSIICFWAPKNPGTAAKTTGFQQLDSLSPGNTVNKWLFENLSSYHRETRQIVWETNSFAYFIYQDTGLPFTWQSQGIYIYLDNRAKRQKQSFCSACICYLSMAIHSKALILSTPWSPAYAFLLLPSCCCDPFTQQPSLQRPSERYNQGETEQRSP